MGEQGISITSHALFYRQGALLFLERRAVEGELLKTLCHSYGPPSAPVPCVKQKDATRGQPRASRPSTTP